MDSSSLQSGRNWKEYTAFPVDLVAEGGSACRRIRVITGSGTITLTSQYAGEGPATALTMAAGESEDVQAKTIAGVTGTITRVRVIW